MNKVFRFILTCIKIIGVLVALGLLYTVYLINQTVKIQHYNDALGDCLSTPGAIVKYEATTPLVGSGLKMTCEHVMPDNRRL